MTIWLLALLLVGASAGMGLRQGAIRVAFSFVGILIGAMLASPIGHLLSPLTAKLPMWGWMLGPVLIFIIIVTSFKIAGATYHRKAVAHYKHKVSDLEGAMWERLNHRLGACVGVANGALYLILVSFAIYTPSYWTYQLGQSEAGQNSGTMKIFNRLGLDLQKTGMSRVAGAVRTMPDEYFDAGDIVGLIYNNPPLTDRLAHYPDIINLAEKPEFQDLANDTDLAHLRDTGAPISELLANPKVKAIVNNNALVKSLWASLDPHLKDLKTYLETGNSPKYDSEKILGKWNFNPNATTTAFRKTKPTVTLAEIRTFRQWMTAFANTTFAAGSPPDNVAVLKGMPTLKPGETMALRGQWKPGVDSYEIDVNGDAGTQQLTATVENGRLTINFAGYSLGFIKAE